MIKIKEPIEFQWDEGNLNKNWTKHCVTNKECEEAFFDEKKKVARDPLHSKEEDRYVLLGKTKKGRLLYTVFSVRNNKVRVISSRDINKKERKLYEKAA